MAKKSSTVSAEPAQGNVDKFPSLVEKMKQTMNPDEQKLLDHLLASGIDIKKADSDGDGVPDAEGLKALFYKDGKLSKTAVFAVLCNTVVLVTYTLQAWLVGATVNLGWLTFNVPSFNVEAAAALMAILNGAYVGNNFVKAKSSK